MNRLIIWIVLIAAQAGISNISLAESQNLMKISERDFVTSRSTRIAQLSNESLGRGIMNLVNDVRGSIKFDDQGNLRDEPNQSNIRKIRNTSFEIIYEINVNRVTNPLVVKKYLKTLEISRTDRNNEIEMMLGIQEGEIFLVLIRASEEEGKLYIWNENQNKFDMKSVGKKPRRKMPELSQTTVWPVFPQKIVFDGRNSSASLSIKDTERIGSLYHAVLSIMDYARLMQVDATYGQFNSMHVGEIPGYSHIKDINIWITQSQKYIFAVNANLENGGRVHIQPDPITIFEYDENNQLKTELRLKSDGRLGYCILK